MKRVFCILMIIMFLGSTLFTILPQMAKADSDLLSLPAAYYSQPPYHLATSSAENHGTLNSVSQQTVDASPGQSISLSINYQVFAPTNPNEINQLFFVESWTPSWPPNGYTISVYDSIPGTPPGQTRTQTISFNAPSTAGTYYLWLCYDGQYSMQDAINYRTASMGGLPAHIKVVIQQTPAQPTFTVYSAHGGPYPSVGSHSYASGSTITCSVPSPVTEGGVIWMCESWSGTGSLAQCDWGSSKSFTITQDSTITWNWVAFTSDYLLVLPAAGYTYFDSVAEGAGLSHGHLNSVSQQTVTAAPGQSISLNVNYQIYAPSNPSEIDQLFFVESWTSGWPPNGYTIPVYNGIPGVSPGQTMTQTISFNAPATPGTYYLWLCVDSQFNMQDAINHKNIVDGWTRTYQSSC